MMFANKGASNLAEQVITIAGWLPGIANGTVADSRQTSAGFGE